MISNIIGGLGNQMFQYAAGCSLSLDLEQPQRLDVSGFANYELHQGFELDPYLPALDFLRIKRSQ